MDSNSEKMGPNIAIQEKEISDKALRAFKKGDFKECLSLLNNLYDQRPYDVKVLHNIAVCEQYKNDFTQTEQYRKKLVHASGLVIGDVNVENVDTLKDPRHSIFFYNRSIICYHMKQYNAALKILTKIFTFMDDLDEDLAYKVSLLLIELYLRTGKADQILSLATYLENIYNSKYGPLLSIRLKSNNLEQDIFESTKIYDCFSIKLMRYKILCYLDIGDILSCEEELRFYTQCSLKAVERKGFEKEERYLARCNNNKYGTLFLRAHLEYLKGSYKQSANIMDIGPVTNTFRQTGEPILMKFYNNLACTYHCMGKPTLAVILLKKAIKENSDYMKTSSRPSSAELLTGRSLYCLGYNHTPDLTYNIGVSLLYCKKPLEAFDYLTEAGQVYHSNPRLWLRLAECCIMVHRMEREENVIKRKEDMLKSVIKRNRYSKVFLNLSLSQDSKYSYEAPSIAVPIPSMEFAALCLRNALFLLSRPNVICPPSRKPNLYQITEMKSSVLAASSYVSLCIGDPLMSLNYGKSLVELPNCSGTHIMLAHLYMAEALVALNRIPEAISHLKPDYSLSLNPPNQNEPPLNTLRSWHLNSPIIARSVFEFNLSVMFCLRGDLENASNHLKTVWISREPNSPIPVQLISLALYIELCSGRNDVALRMLRLNLGPHVYKKLYKKTTTAKGQK